MQKLGILKLRERTKLHTQPRTLIMLLSIYYSLIVSTTSVQPQVSVEITPISTIGHKTDNSAIGNEPQEFQIPAEDRK
jgi:hypothetical protein